MTSDLTQFGDNILQLVFTLNRGTSIPFKIYLLGIGCFMTSIMISDFEVKTRRRARLLP